MVAATRCVAATVNATKAAGVDYSAQLELLRSLTATIGDFQKAIGALDKAVSKGVIHKNQAANRKSAIAKRVGALSA